MFECVRDCMSAWMNTRMDEWINGLFWCYWNGLNLQSIWAFRALIYMYLSCDFCFTCCSQSLTLPQGSSASVESTTVWRHCSVACYTGLPCSNVLTTNLLCSFTSLLRRNTDPIALYCVGVSTSRAGSSLRSEAKGDLKVRKSKTCFCCLTEVLEHQSTIRTLCSYAVLI